MALFDRTYHVTGKVTLLLRNVTRPEGPFWVRPIGKRLEPCFEGLSRGVRSNCGLGALKVRDIGLIR